MRTRLTFMELSDEQRETLRATQGVIKQYIGKALDRFYSRAKLTPETARFFRDDAHMGQAKAAQIKHWSHLAAGDFEGGYYASVRRIGATHARIGLEPRWYVGGYALIVEELLRAVARQNTPWRRMLRLFRGPSQADASIAVVKAALLDMELSLSIYFEEAQATREKAAHRLETALAQLAEGDLTNQLKDMPKDFAHIEHSYNDTIAKIRGMIGSVTDGTHRINQGIAEIAAAADDLAHRTQSNAASLEQTAAAVSQMDQRLRATAHAATETVERADQAIATVDSGREVADSAVQSMHRVLECAKGIDGVIEGLDKISFQTRVLAMNAAVEAGRAGDAGRGFAVVADLVSALAMRAEEEAKRAREQLSTTQAEIGTAVEAVRRVDTALSDISGDVGQVHGLLSGMATDNGAQSSAVSEIAIVIGAMDQSTQQNAAMVEQTSAATRTLQQEVDSLCAMTRSFRTDTASSGRDASAAFRNPVKPLPAAAVSALVRRA